MADLKRNTLRFIGILPNKSRKIMWKWLNGWTLLEIGRKHRLSTREVRKIIEKNIDRIDAYCYNRERYISVFGHLFDEWSRNRRRNHPLIRYDKTWGLTHKEIWLLRMWKVDAQTPKAMMQALRISEATLNQYKSMLGRKVDVDEFERRDFDSSRSDSNYSNSFELSGI